MDFEYILAKLTESQLRYLVVFVRDGLRPGDATDEDAQALLGLGLFEREEIVPPTESFTGGHEERARYGPPIPSGLGEDFVAWYLKRK